MNDIYANIYLEKIVYIIKYNYAVILCNNHKLHITRILIVKSLLHFYY